MHASGIYVIRNIKNGRVYVGSAVSFHARWTKHQNELRSGKHKNYKLTHSVAKHGIESFRFEPILICDKALLLFYEQRAMDVLDSYNTGYNCSPTAASQLGVTRSPETRKRMSLGKIGKKMPAYAVEKSRLANLGRPSPRKGVTLSDETKDKIRQKLLGGKLTDECKAKISAALKGRKLNRPSKLLGRKHTRQHIINRSTSSSRNRLNVLPATIRQMRALYADGVKSWQISDVFAVSRSHTLRIITRQSHWWID